MNRSPVSEERVWKTVMTTGSLVEALLVRQLLEEYGLPVHIRSPASFRIFPFSGLRDDWYQIQVPTDVWEEAQTLLNQHRPRYPWLRVIPGGRGIP